MKAAMAGLVSASRARRLPRAVRRPAIAERRRARDVHTGDWTEVLPAVTAFLEPFAAATDPAVIHRARKEDSRITGLATDERILAQALLNTLDPIRVNVIDGRRRSVGQHRICRPAPPA